MKGGKALRVLELNSDGSLVPRWKKLSLLINKPLGLKELEKIFEYICKNSSQRMRICTDLVSASLEIQEHQLHLNLLELKKLYEELKIRIQEPSPHLSEKTLRSIQLLETTPPSVSDLSQSHHMSLSPRENAHLLSVPGETNGGRHSPPISLEFHSFAEEEESWDLPQDLEQNMDLPQDLEQNMDLSQDLEQNMDLPQYIEQNMDLSQDLEQNMDLHQDLEQNMDLPQDREQQEISTPAQETAVSLAHSLPQSDELLSLKSLNIQEEDEVDDEQPRPSKRQKIFADTQTQISISEMKRNIANTSRAVTTHMAPSRRIHLLMKDQVKELKQLSPVAEARWSFSSDEDEDDDVAPRMESLLRETEKSLPSIHVSQLINEGSDPKTSRFTSSEILEEPQWERSDITDFDVLSDNLEDFVRDRIASLGENELLANIFPPREFNRATMAKIFNYCIKLYQMREINMEENERGSPLIIIN